MSRPSSAAVGSDGFPLPVLPVPPIDPAAWRQPHAWKNIPRVRDFTREGSGDGLLIFRSMCRTARDDEHIYLRFTGFDPDISAAVMTPEYTGWVMDDAADFYITGADGVTRQLVFNSAGGWIYFKDMAPGGAMNPPPEIHGSRDADSWTAVLKLPLAALGLRIDEPLRIKVMRNAPREFLHHASGWGADGGGRPGAALKMLSEPLSADRCRRIEEELDRGRRVRIMNLHADRRTAAKLRCLPLPARAEAEKLPAGLTAPADMREGEAVLARITEFIRANMGRIDAVSSADFTTPCGTVKLLNGVNVIPPLTNRENWDGSADFAALRIPCARFHDDALVNPGMRLVDVSLIFGRPDADPSDPGSYYFEQTDDYVASCISLGSRIIYRLGVSIEHSVKKYFARAPSDYHRFAEICAGIVRHYNAGWANGFHCGIDHWEVWNEPDLGPKMWDRTMDDYCDMYIVAAKRLKAEFPDIKIGGPAITSMHPAMLKNFLIRCRAAGADVDFISWHRYTGNPAEMVNQVNLAGLTAADCGFDDVELNLNEWHYMPGTFTDLQGGMAARKRLLTAPDGLNGIDSAAFNTTVLSAWQDTPMTMANFYMTVGGWGFYDPYREKYPTYYSFLAFAPFADHRRRVRTTSGRPGLTILAGRDGESGGMILVSAFRMPEKSVSLSIRGLSRDAVVRVNSVEEGHGLAEHRDYTFDGEAMTIVKHSDSAIFQIMIDGIS